MKAFITIIAALICLTSKAQSQETDTVYINPEAESYHHKNCDWLERDSVATTLQQAKEKGYTACPVCHKPERDTSIQPGQASTPKSGNSSGTQNKSKTSPTKTYSTRCQATTQKGYQCKRMVKEGSYCWQHK